MARWRLRRSDDNLFICNLSLNTQSQTNHLTRFTKAIVWLHHFYLRRPLDCQVVKTSAFSWPICQKHIRESYWSFPLDLFSSFFSVSFLFFLLSWHPVTDISFSCQQYVSTNNLHSLCFRSLLFIQRPFLGYIDNVGIYLSCWFLLGVCLGGRYESELVHETGFHLNTIFGLHCMYISFFFQLWKILDISKSYFILNL